MLSFPYSHLIELLNIFNKVHIDYFNEMEARNQPRITTYSVCESWFLIHQDVYHDLFVCSWWFID